MCVKKAQNVTFFDTQNHTELHTIPQGKVKKFSRKVKELTEAKGMTQAKLANVICKYQQSVQRLEAGMINPSIYYLCQLAKGL